MDAVKKQRKVLRTAFTKALTAFATKLDSDCSKEDKMVAFQFLETKMTELDTVHSTYNQALFQSDLDDETITREVESDDTYKSQYLTAKMRITTVMSAMESGTRTTPNNVVKTSKFPKLELPKFSGNIKEWLPFWSQFKKIHEDPSTSYEDKFQYLLQAAVPESRASELVKSFPPTGENYVKAITSLRNRFGRDDVVVKFYVRELLGLVLQNAVKGNKKAALSGIYDKVECYIRALETLGVTTDKCAAMLYPLVESSLPEEVLRAWQRSGLREATDRNEQRETTDRLARLLKFLQLEVENEERIDMALTGFGLPTEQDKNKKSKSKSESAKDTASASVLLVSKEARKAVCIFCNSSHESLSCEKARKLSLEERKDIVKKENACLNCLIRGHIAQKCRTRLRCDWCTRRHVLLMCPDIARKELAPANKLIDNKKTTDEHNLATVCERPDVCLQTLRVKVYSASREKVVRAVIDTASQCSYICTDITRQLGYVSRGEVDVSHSLFGGVKSECKKHDVFLIHVKDLNDSYACNFTAMSQDTICGTISSIKSGAWVEELRAKDIILTDIGGKDNPIEILIGADVAGKLLTGVKHNLKNELTAFETHLGWTVMGKLPKESSRSDMATMVTTLFVQEACPSDLWRLDVIGITDPIGKTSKVVRDEQTREFLKKTAKLNPDGRYEIKLPWIEDHAPVSDNYDIARNRLKKCVENLQRQNLFEAYDSVFKEWLSEGIIEKAPGEDGRLSHYLPHRPVIKTHGTTKIRPVFDASACKKGHPSLNQCLETGPNLIELLPSSLNRFREGEIGIVADIKKAFLQIAVGETDRDWLRFLWIVDHEIVAFRHCRVVFGLACSPFLLAAILELHLSSYLENSEEARNTAKKLKQSFYVDNCLTSANSNREVKEFIREAKSIMIAGGFELRGWEISGDSTDSETSLVLGILWDKRKDTISINPAVLKVTTPVTVTKRTILSATHKVFDPIGFTCPVSLLPKLLLKDLWAEKLDWDAEIVDNRRDRFINWLGELPVLNQIKIPRKLGKGNLTLHTFSDASGSAYAAAVYARVECENSVSVRLLSARSRIAPQKTTIPRLELMAATIAVRLTVAAAKSLTRKVLKTTFWSDSTTVLAWIKRDIQWGAFVWNRVKEIRSLSEPGDWRYVPGELNPADLPSRGCSPSQLVQSEWWLGPKWLYRPALDWPMADLNFKEEEIRNESTKASLVHLVSGKSSEFTARNYFSSYNKLIRFLAWMHRFFTNRREIIDKKSTGKENNSETRNVLKTTYLSETDRRKLHLTFAEIKAVEIKLLKYLQDRMFNSTSQNKLSSFKTMKDENGLLILKTKIFYREDNFNFRCPILLPNDDDIIYLLARECHEFMGHAGTQIVMASLRERFWIISLRKTIKSVIANCVICKKQKTKRMESEAPPLPLNRVRDAAIFEVVGIDFAGPLMLRGGGKAWICIFTCAVYRAVHFELVSTLSTQGFLECLRRFVARRGRPRTIYSDNGTNFTGAANVLNKLNWEKISKHSSAVQIEWRFNPPAAPWWGGWWERLIGILKTLLRKILGKASLPYESLQTIVCDAEAIINSRPLTYITEDPCDLKPLSPSLFLQDIQEFGVPDCDMLYRAKLNRKLKHRQKIFENIRKRFRTEYLGQLLLKDGKKETRKIKVGDVVLIGDDTHRRIDWPLARVVDVIPGRDGQGRVVVLKTKSGLFKRPIQRIYPLEISREESEVVSDLRGKVQCEEVRNQISAEAEPPNSKINVPLACKQQTGNPKNTTTRRGRVVKKPNRFEC